MSYASNCEEELGSHVDLDCPDREFGRVRSVAIISKAYLSTLLANPTDPAVWQTGIDSGDIDIISKTAGSFDPGEPKALKGYGDNKESNGIPQKIWKLTGGELKLALDTADKLAEEHMNS